MRAHDELEVKAKIIQMEVNEKCGYPSTISQSIKYKELNKLKERIERIEEQLESR